MTPETAIIIRTKNEGEHIGEILEILSKQTYQDFEIIIVDSGSKDDTLLIAKKFEKVKIYIIPASDFSYPYALNFGIKKTAAEKYIAIISGHSIPISITWLEDGIENFNEGADIIGVYGYIDPLPDGSFWDKVIIKSANFLRGKKYQIVTVAGMGVLGFTNAIIKKEFWEKKNFNEAYGAGGEDGEWAGYWLSKGFKVVKNPKFTVCHSHKLGLVGWHKQVKYWGSLANPMPFMSLSFRKDKAHKR